jgi:hypothetical protein
MLDIPDFTEEDIAAILLGLDVVSSRDERR